MPNVPPLPPATAAVVVVQVEGDANDYVGKGLSGGKVVVYPKAEALAKGFVAEDNVIVGKHHLILSWGPRTNLFYKSLFCFKEVLR